jgi:hypothetical protein
MIFSFFTLNVEKVFLSLKDLVYFDKSLILIIKKRVSFYTTKDKILSENDNILS